MKRLLLCALLALGACSGGSDGTGTPVTPPTPSISVALSVNNVTSGRGGSFSSTVTLTRGGNYTGAVTLSAGTLPAGITATFAPATLSGNTSTSVATFSIANTAAPGVVTITVTATGSGVSPASSTIALVIPTPGITVAAGVTALSVVQGTSGNVPITVARSLGLNEPVALTATGLPAGVTATFAPATVPVGSGTSTLALAVAPTAAVGTSTITITATANGVPAQSATVALTVASAATPAMTIGAAPAALNLVAGQSGTSTVTVVRTGGFAGDVALAVTGAPSGMSATLAPTTVAAAATTSTLTVATTSAVAPGTYNLALTASGTGVTAATTSVAVVVSAAPGVTVSAIPAQQLSQGTSSPTPIALVLTRTGGLTGDLTMALEGAPTGVSATFSPATVTGAGTQMTLNVAATTAPGTYTLTVRASGAAGASGSTTFSLTVTAAATGSFAMNVVPGTLSVVQGQTGLATINIARTGGFTGGVTLTATGAPAGTTTTFTPSQPTGTQSQLGIDVGAATPAGTYTLTIRGQGAGVPDVTTTLTLTVTASGGGGTGNVNWTFCDPTRFPLWFAVQSGTSGSWTRVQPTGTTTRVFNFSVNAVGGVAYALPIEGAGTQVQVMYLTAAEISAGAQSECQTNRATKSLNGSVANLPAGGTAFVGIGGGTATVAGGATTYTISGVDDGLTDLTALRTTFNTTTFAFTPDRGVLRRNVNYAAGSTVPVIDFTGAESFAVASADYTIANAGSDLLVTTTAFITDKGFIGTFAFPSLGGGGAVQKVYGVPTANTQSGDFHQVLAFASSGTETAQSVRTIAQYNRTLANRTLTLGPALSVGAVSSVAASPYRRFSATGSWQSEYGDAIGVNFRQSTTGANAWNIYASRSYVGSGAGTWTLTMPDFSGVAGFNTAWALGTGTITWELSGSGGILGLAGTSWTGFTEGGTFRAASRTGTVN